MPMKLQMMFDVHRAVYENLQTKNELYGMVCTQMHLYLDAPAHLGKRSL